MDAFAEKGCEVWYQPGERPVFCYRTGMTVYEETLDGGVLVSSGWNTAGYPLNVLSNCPTRLDHRAFSEPAAFGAVVNGVSAEYGLRFAGFTRESTDEGVKATLTLTSEALPLTVKIVTLLDGTAMFTRSVTLENTGASPLTLGALRLFGGGLEEMDRAALTPENNVEALYSLGYFSCDTWGREGEFCWKSLSPGAFGVETRFNADRFRHPLVFLKNNVTGVHWFMQAGYSGGVRFVSRLWAREEDPKSRVSLSAEVTGYAPLYVIAPGEAFVSPEIHVGAVSGGLDDAVNEMHAHIRRSVLCDPAADPSALLVGSGMGAEHDMSVATTKAFIRQLAEMGAEVFIIDAGWVCPPTQGAIDWGGYNGLNRPDPARYPNGIKELAEDTHANGMKFGLWVEIERLGEKAPLFREKPEWRAKNIYGERDGGFLDLTQPEAAAWAEEELARIITEYGVDLLRVDYNVSCRSYVLRRDTGFGAPECLSLRQFEAVYNMYRRLKRRFPHVIFENCAGGGGRTDLGQMKAFNHTWVSDWQKLPHSVLITNGMTMALPPERVDRLFAGMGAHVHGSFEAGMRNTMLTHMSLNVVSPAMAQANPAQTDFIRHSVSLYKSFIRPFLPTANIYHHTPEADEAVKNGYVALEAAAPDGSRAVLAAFSLAGTGARRVTVFPRGVKANRTYAVTLDNTGESFTVEGCVLRRGGVTLELPSALASELVLFEAV